MAALGVDLVSSLTGVMEETTGQLGNWFYGRGCRVTLNITGADFTTVMQSFSTMHSTTSTSFPLFSESAILPIENSTNLISGWEEEWAAGIF
jgi:hypothetical protein